MGIRSVRRRIRASRVILATLDDSEIAIARYLDLLYKGERVREEKICTSDFMRLVYYECEANSPFVYAVETEEIMGCVVDE